MEVCINSYPVDFELEGERTVTDVIDSVSQWARDRDLVFTDVLIDDKQYSIDDVPQEDLAEVASINCIVRSRADVVFSTIDEGVRYCERAQSFIAGGSREQGAPGDINDLATGIDWLVDVADALFGLLGLAPDRVKVRDRSAAQLIQDLQTLKQALEKAPAKPEAWTLAAGKESYFSDMKDMFRVLLLSNEMKQLIVQSIDSPDMILHSLKSLREEFSGQMKNIEETAIAFQSGKDTDGSSGMERFIDFVYRYTRACYQAVPVFQVELGDIEVQGVSLEEKNERLHDFLNQTIIVLENNDIISLSDMLEYEMLPALENLGDYLDLLIEAIIGSEGSR